MALPTPPMFIQRRPLPGEFEDGAQLNGMRLIEAANRLVEAAIVLIL